MTEEYIGSISLGPNGYTKNKVYLGHLAPRKGKQMNEITDKVAEELVDLDHFILALDKDGNEIKVNRTGEFYQDVEDKEESETITIH